MFKFCHKFKITASIKSSRLSMERGICIGLSLPISSRYTHQSIFTQPQRSMSYVILIKYQNPIWRILDFLKCLQLWSLFINCVSIEVDLFVQVFDVRSFRLGLLMQKPQTISLPPTWFLKISLNSVFRIETIKSLVYKFISTNLTF